MDAVALDGRMRWLRNPDGSRMLSGTIRNASGRMLEFVQVMIDFNDDDGALAGSREWHKYYFPAHERWEFQVDVPTPECTQVGKVTFFTR